MGKCFSKTSVTSPFESWTMALIPTAIQGSCIGVQFKRALRRGQLARSFINDQGRTRQLSKDLPHMTIHRFHHIYRPQNEMKIRRDMSVENQKIEHVPENWSNKWEDYDVPQVQNFINLSSACKKDEDYGAKEAKYVYFKDGNGVGRGQGCPPHLYLHPFPVFGSRGIPVQEFKSPGGKVSTFHFIIFII